MFENLTVTQIWELFNTKFSLFGMISFMLISFVVMRLIKRSVDVVHFVAKLPPALLGGGLNVGAAGCFGYSVMDFFSKSPNLSPQMNGFLMAASFTLALVALKYERRSSNEKSVK